MLLSHCCIGLSSLVVTGRWHGGSQVPRVSWVTPPPPIRCRSWCRLSGRVVRGRPRQVAAELGFSKYAAIITRAGTSSSSLRTWQRATTLLSQWFPPGAGNWCVYTARCWECPSKIMKYNTIQKITGLLTRQLKAVASWGKFLNQRYSYPAVNALNHALWKHTVAFAS